MKVGLACDHAGFEMKEDLKLFLAQEGYDVDDLGAYSTENTDYPDWAEKLARRVSQGTSEKGILICSTGVGMAIVANRFPGVRAALVTDIYSARQCKEHVDANVLVLASYVTGKATARILVREWLTAQFTGGKHQRRVDKITALEKSLYKEREEKPKE